MLAIPIKRCARLEWAPPLKAYLSSHYSQREVDVYGPELDALDAARDHSVASTCKTATTASAGASDAVALDAISKLAEYTQMLLAVESRLDFSDDAPGAPSLSFSWNDAFKPTKKITRHDVAFERVCVLFNAGAVHSFAGIGQDRSTAEGIKSSCQHFQRAAGIFHYLETDVLKDGLPGGSLTSDLRPEGLRMLRTVMLAQAQACFYEKAVKGKMKPAILTKLAMQAGAWYGEANEQCEAPTMHDVLDPSWAAHIKFQKLCFSASAKYWHAKVVHAKADAAGTGYGEEVGWLFSAENSCNGAIQAAQSSSLPASMLNTVRALLGAIQRELARAVEDNNSIYMESVPRNLTVDGLPKYPMAKTVPVEDSLKMLVPDLHPEGNILAQLVPVAVHKAVSAYGEMLGASIQSLTERAKKASNDARKALDDAGLPSSIEASMPNSGSVGYPDASWARIEKDVLAHGGVAALHASFAENVASAKDLEDLLRECTAALDSEARQDDAGRRAHGGAWSMQPSAQLSEHLRADIDRYAGLLSHAKSADGQVGQMIQTNQGLLAKLDLPRRELDVRFPGAEGSSAGVSNAQDPALVRAREALSSLLVSIGLMLAERDKLVGEQLAEIKNKEIGADSTFTKRLTSGGIKEAERLASDGASSELKSMMDAAVREFTAKNPVVLKIEASIRDQAGALTEIMQSNSKFMSLVQHNELSSKRSAFLSEMDTCIARYTELRGNIAEGKGFYSDLLTRCKQLLTTCKDHCFVRNEQRNSLLEELRKAKPAAAAAPPSYQATSTAQPPSYTAAAVAPPYPTGAVVPGAAPTGAGGGVEDGKLALMRAMVPGVSDNVLKTYLDGAGGDINIAVNHYFEQQS